MANTGIRYPYKQGSKVLLQTAADLHLRGWDEVDILISPGDERHIHFHEDGNVVSVFGNMDMWVSLPAGAEVRIDRVGGDAYITDLKGPVEINHVGGDLTLRGATRLEVGQVGGDMTVANVTESLSIRRLGGDLTGEVQGSVSAEVIGGDCELSAKDGVRLRTGGDAELAIASVSTDEVVLTAGGDVTIFAPADLDARLDLTSNSREINVKVGSTQKYSEEQNIVLALGNGARAIRVRAGGDVTVSDAKAPLLDLEDEFRGMDRGWDVEPIGEGRSEYWNGFEERIQKRAEEAARRAERRVQEAMERVERSNRIREKSMGDVGKWLGFFGVGGVGHDMGRHSHHGGHSVPPTPPAPSSRPTPPEWAQSPNPTGEPVSPAVDFATASDITNEERMLVLKMLQEHKISVEDAEQLLASLEGQFD
jgi:hypothetical protein